MRVLLRDSRISLVGGGVQQFGRFLAIATPEVITMLALIMTTMLLVPTPQGQDATEPTRSDELRTAREEKTQHLEPPSRASLETALYNFKEKRVMERFQAGF